MSITVARVEKDLSDIQKLIESDKFSTARLYTIALLDAVKYGANANPHLAGITDILFSRVIECINRFNVEDFESCYKAALSLAETLNNHHWQASLYYENTNRQLKNSKLKAEDYLILQKQTNWAWHFAETGGILNDWRERLSLQYLQLEIRFCYESLFELFKRQINVAKTLEEFQACYYRIDAFAKDLLSINACEQAESLYHMVQSWLQKSREVTKNFDLSLVKKSLEVVNQAQLGSASSLIKQPQVLKLRDELQKIRQVEPALGSFWTHQEEFNQRLQKYLGGIFETAEKHIGPPPVAYQLLIFGSLSSNDALPRSDAEFGILLEAPLKANQQLYFKVLFDIAGYLEQGLGEGDESNKGFHFDGFSSNFDKIIIGTSSYLIEKLHEDLQLDSRKKEGWYNRFDNEAHSTFCRFLAAPGYRSDENIDLFQNYKQELQKLLAGQDSLTEKPYRAALTLAYARLIHKGSNIQRDILDLKYTYRNLLAYPMLLLGLYHDCPEIHPVKIATWLASKAHLSKGFVQAYNEGYEYIQTQRWERHMRPGALVEISDQGSATLENIRARLVMPLLSWLATEKIDGQVLQNFDPIFAIKDMDYINYLRKQEYIAAPDLLYQIDGLTYHHMPENEDSLFQAVSFYLNEDQEALRNEIANDMIAQPNMYQDAIAASGKNVNDYAEYIRTSAWAQSVEIVELMNLLKRPIIIISPNEQVVNGEDANRKGVPIFVFHKSTIQAKNKNHFDIFFLQPNRNARKILNRLLQVDVSLLMQGKAYALAYPQHTSDEIIAYYHELSAKEQFLFLKHFRRFELRPDLLDQLSRNFKEDGQRVAQLNAEAEWQSILMEKITDPLPVNLVDEKGQICLEWITQEGQPIVRLLKKEFQTKWLEENWIDDKGKIQEKARKIKDGRRIVIPLNDHAFLKVYPEMPGRQLLAQSLAWRISGNGPLTTIARMRPVGSDHTYPVLLSQNLGKTLQNRETLAIAENKVNAKAFTLKVIETLLLSYEDDKFDNVSFVDKQGYLSSFDSDRAFADPLLKRRDKLLRTEIKVNSKSIVFCMPQMKLMLDADAIKEFCSLNPKLVLTEWLKEQGEYNKQVFTTGVLEVKQSCLFKSSEVAQWSASSGDDSHIVAALEPGTLKTLYQKWLRIRAALLSDCPTTHLELISRIEPYFASFYEASFNKSDLTTDKRFNSLPTDYLVIEEQSVSPVEQRIVCLQTVGRAHDRMITSITIPTGKKDLKQAILLGEIYDPYRALKELEYTYQLFQRIDQVALDVMKVDGRSFLALGVNADYIKEQVVKRIDFSKLKHLLAYDHTIKLHKEILQIIQNGSYRELYLSGCLVLDDDQLKIFLKQSPDLHTLEITHCDKLTRKTFNNLEQYCPQLQKLSLSGYTQAHIESKYILSHSSATKLTQLRMLTIKDAPSLTSILFETPKLQSLILHNCAQLKNITTASAELKLLQLIDCPKISNSGIEKIANEFTTLTFAQLSGCQKIANSDVLETYPWLMLVADVFTTNLFIKFKKKFIDLNALSYKDKHRVIQKIRDALLLKREFESSIEQELELINSTDIFKSIKIKNPTEIIKSISIIIVNLELLISAAINTTFDTQLKINDDVDVDKENFEVLSYNDMDRYKGYRWRSHSPIKIKINEMLTLHNCEPHTSYYHHSRINYILNLKWQAIYKKLKIFGQLDYLLVVDALVYQLKDTNSDSAKTEIFIFLDKIGRSHPLPVINALKEQLKNICNYYTKEKIINLIDQLEGASFEFHSKSSVDELLAKLTIAENNAQRAQIIEKLAYEANQTNHQAIVDALLGVLIKIESADWLEMKKIILDTLYELGLINPLIITNSLIDEFKIVTDGHVRVLLFKSLNKFSQSNSRDVIDALLPIWREKNGKLKYQIGVIISNHWEASLFQSIDDIIKDAKLSKDVSINNDEQHSSVALDSNANTSITKLQQKDILSITFNESRNTFFGSSSSSSSSANGGYNEIAKQDIPQIDGLDFERMLGDGHCLYHAVAVYLEKDQQTLRTELADLLETTPDKYKDVIEASGKDFKSYIQGIRTKEWADHLEIVMLMTLLNRPIVIIEPGGKIRNKDDIERLKSEKPIFVYYNDVDHYDSFTLKSNKDGREILNRLMQANEPVSDLLSTSPQSTPRIDKNVGSRMQP
ncbi:MAG: hypothetical protein P4M12_04585 [Gammaproteobacteria bacterium]|nr:hypothetical protein [Gammaproteobacteria bacterium]